MSAATSKAVSSRPSSGRRGLSMTWTLGALSSMLAVAIGGGVYALLPGSEDPSSSAMVHTVSRGTFTNEVTSRGELESGANHEVRNEVKSRIVTGTQIIDIVPEGTYVEPGDFLVKLDSSFIEQDVTAQQIAVNTSKAIMVQAQTTYETAELAKKEYLDGTYLQEAGLIKGEIFVAEENLRRADEYLRYTQRLAARGFVPSSQLDADRFAVDKARNDLETARTKLKVLANYTKAKMLKQLESDIITFKTKWESEQASYDLEVKKLNELEEQLKKCTIHATASGEVVYAHDRERRGDDIIIEPGAQVVERQVIVRLPDPNEMQATIKIHESQITQVQPGMPASISLDAYSDVSFSGHVTRISRYPTSSRWSGSNVRQYETVVRIDDPKGRLPAGQRLKPGMTAKVVIHVDRQDNVLQVPVTAVREVGGQAMCVVRTADGWQPRPVVIGATNDEFLVINSGLSEGEDVSLNPRKYLEEDETTPSVPARIPGREQIADKSAAAGGDEGRNGPPSEGAAPAGANPGAIAGGMFERFDTNGDGSLSREEMPEQFRPQFAATDANGDGAIDRQELSSAMARRMADMTGSGGASPESSE